MGDPGPADEPPVRPAEHTSGWAFNWTGLLAVVLIVVVAVVAWRWLGGASSSSDAGSPPNPRSASATSAPTDSPEGAAPSTTRAPTTPSPAATAPPTPATTAPDRQVLIRGEMKPCRFGANCLVAGFTIAGFDPHPGRFVCIYPNSRSDFGFNNDGVDEACITADAGDTITIEVDGVRSATISEENLDGE